LATGSIEAWRQRVAADSVLGVWRWAERAGVAGPRSRFAARFQHVGEGTAFGFPPGTSMGERWIRIGSDNLIASGVVFTAGMWPDEPFVPPDGWAIRIGDRCTISRGAAFVGRVGIDVGDDVTFGPDVYVTDHNHEYAEPDVPISRQWVVEAPVSIGSGSWLGTGAVVLPGSQLGTHVAVAAGSVVRGEIPDRCVVAGSPAKVVRQWDIVAGRWDPPLPSGRGRHAVDVPPGWYDSAAL
jgi:acetyltransferase-like isoleucine patch superfamily enzyme